MTIGIVGTVVVVAAAGAVAVLIHLLVDVAISSYAAIFVVIVGIILTKYNRMICCMEW